MIILIYAFNLVKDIGKPVLLVS